VSTNHLMIAAALSGLLGSACASANDGDAAEIDGLASQNEAWTRNALTRTQEMVVLKTIDNACADTWCEGDHDFAFRRLSCSWDTATCTLMLQITSRDSFAADRPWHWRSCKTSGFSGYPSLVATAATGETWLTASYDGALNECIVQLESNLR
jgi:hypothetical protein